MTSLRLGDRRRELCLELARLARRELAVGDPDIDRTGGRDQSVVGSVHDQVA